ncbi:hypothetical protein HDU92_007018 [Lobulomyces angularis]|nr:hypothetical protein HDU92_007018 [Lobulomyces angularis]
MIIEVHGGTNEIASLSSFIGVSFVVKEKCFLSDSLVATFIGIIFGPVAFNIINPFKLTNDINKTIYYFTDIVISIQIMAAAISLSKKFWNKSMWLTTALVFWKVIGFTWYESLLIAACCAPTDPILANSIVNGRFAELHIHPRVRQLLSAESASNDGCVFPLFQLAYFLMKFSMAEAFLHWSYATILYEIIGAAILGAIIGYVSRISLRSSEKNNWIDKKNFLVFELALAMFTSGTVTMLGMSSFVAVLVTGTVFAWDGWFAEETHDAHVQEVLDMLVNIVFIPFQNEVFFIFFGSIIPWNAYGTAELPYWILITAAVLILIVRRLPAVLLMMRFMTPLLSFSEAFFVGWFGPVGVGALWYQTRGSILFPDNKLFGPVVAFIVFSSVICHGIMVPFVHLTIVGIRYTSTQSRTLSQTSRGRGIAPTWPTGVAMSAGVISSPEPLVRTADGRYIPASSICLKNTESLVLFEKEFQNKETDLEPKLIPFNEQSSEEIQVGASDSTLDGIADSQNDLC